MVFMKNSILVTGGAGYIGSHTCKALAEAGFRPVAFDNLDQGSRSAVKWGPFVEGDLSDRDVLYKVFREHRIKAVIHFAAYAYVSESMEEPGKYFRNNVVNTLNLLEVMHTAGVQYIVFSSTCATYGLPDKIPINEDHPLRPVNPYGESKLFVERALHWHGVAHGMRSVALRYFNAAGADPQAEVGEFHHPETHLVPIILQAALGQRPYVEIYGTDYPTPDGTAIRDYIHVTDLALAHVLALRYLLEGGRSTVLNLGTGIGYSVREVVATVERKIRSRIPVREGKRRLGDPPVLIADAGRAKETLCWKPKYSDLETIVQTAWRWHKERCPDIHGLKHSLALQT